MAQELPEELLVANVGQKVLIAKDGKVLMCRGTETFHDLGKRWDFPGGRIHTGEEPVPALERELKEELGVDFNVGKPLFTMITYDTPTNVPRYYVVFEATPANPTAEFVVAEDELSELKWVGPEDVATLVTWEQWRVFLTGYFKIHA